MQGSDEIVIEETLAAETTDKTMEDSATAVEATAVEAAPTVSELAAAQAEALDYKDRWLRSQAEFANARKRMDKERGELYGTATTDVIKKLLPVLDDFERARNNVPETIQGHSWLDGLELVQRKLATILESFNVATIQAVGQPFDPNLHEAITQEPSATYDSGTVCRELQKGYKIGERVIRPSLVVVAE